MHNMKGFSLTELLVTTLILSILALWAANLSSQLQKTIELYTTLNRVKQLIDVNKHRALNKHQALTICGSRGESCDQNWSVGILLFQDNNRNGVIEQNDAVIEYVPLHLKTANLSWRGFNTTRLVIEPLGITFASNGSFNYCPKDNDRSYIRQIVINRGGRVRFSRDSNADGIHENGNGEPLTCP